MLCFRRNNIDQFPASVLFGELDNTITEREQCVVLACTNVASCVKCIADLPDYDGACRHILSAKSFDTPMLRIGISTVLNATLTFFMSHFYLTLLMIKPINLTGFF